MKLLSLAAILGLLLTALCSGVEPADAPAAKGPHTHPWRAMPDKELAGWKTKLVKGTKEKARWTKDPLRIIRHFRPPSVEGSPEQQWESAYEVVPAKKGANKQDRRVTAIVTETGYADDSLRGKKFRFLFERQASGTFLMLKGETAYSGRGLNGWSDQFPR